jgi:hypothetical protein
MFSRGKAKVKSISVAIAMKLGFLCPEEAKKADEVVEREDADTPTLGLLIDKGFLDQVQAAKVRAVRQKEAPLEELSENIKKTRVAVRGVAGSGAR